MANQCKIYYFFTKEGTADQNNFNEDTANFIDSAEISSTLLPDNTTVLNSCMLSYNHVQRVIEATSKVGLKYVQMYTDSTLNTQLASGDIYEIIKDTPLYENSYYVLNVFVKVEEKTVYTWNYGPNADFTIETADEAAPDILNKFIWRKTDGNNYMYEFSEWTADEKNNKIFNANYTTTLYDNSLFKYTINGINIFENAEPYYFGSGAPSTDYFVPIGEDSIKETPENDIKVQAYDGSNFASMKTFNSFTIDNYPIAYIEQGTFPKLSDTCLIAEHTSDQSTDVNSINLKVYYTDAYSGMFDFTNLGKTDEVIKVPSRIIFGENNLSLLFEKHGLKTLPTRLGIAIVGGGGGAGGYDITSCECECGDDTDAVIPGGAGGGGEITLGVLNLEYPQLEIKKNGDEYLLFASDNYIYKSGDGWANTIKAKEWFSTIDETIDFDAKSLEELTTILRDNLIVKYICFQVKGGNGGWSNGGSDNRGGNKDTVKDGNNGHATRLEFQIELEDTNGKQYITKQRVVLVANGGNGGKKGDINKDEILGGAGGFGGQNTVSKETTSKNGHCYFIKSISGCNGGSFTISENEGKAQPMEAYNKTLYFSATEPTDEFKKIISHEKLTLDQVGTANKDKRIWTLRGGWSWGNGGWTTTPTKGGGGSSLKVKEDQNANYIEPKETDDAGTGINEPSNGADGWVALYY